MVESVAGQVGSYGGVRMTPVWEVEMVGSGSGWLAELQEESFAAAGAATAAAYPPKRRLSGDQLAAVFAGRRYAIIATARPDSRAHAAPGVFVLVDRVIWLPTVAKAQRTRNVTAHPWLSLVIAEGDGAAHGVVIVEGPAEVVAAPPEAVRAAGAAKNSGNIDWADTWLRLTPERLLSFAGPQWRAPQP